MHLNQPYQPRLCVGDSKESLVHNEASKANLDAYKSIIKWQPFFEQVYGVFAYEINSLRDVTSVNFKSKKFHEDIISVRQDIFLRNISSGMPLMDSLEVPCFSSTHTCLGKTDPSQATSCLSFIIIIIIITTQHHKYRV